MESLISDVRYGLRTMLRSPVLTVVAVLSLALGIGANTAIFSLLDAVMLRTLPVHEPERLVLFGKGESQGITISFPDQSWDLYSYSFYREIRQKNEVFSGVAAMQSMSDPGSVDSHCPRLLPAGTKGFVSRSHGRIEIRVRLRG